LYQRKILAILWMCPIYATTSWLSLVFVNLSEYLGIIKDLYEAYIIYMFLAFLIAVLGKGDRAVAVNTLAIHADHLKPPMSIFGPKEFDNPREKADAVLLQCQIFAMQFVLFKPLCGITRLILEKRDIAENLSHYDYRSPFFYVLIVENLSVFFAFMGLLKFYHAAEEDLGWCRPFPKFLCIKGVVFMTFWQGLVISILANTPSLTSPKSGAGNGTEITVHEDAEDKWAAQAQNFLICLEMLIFSVAHFFAFPTSEWQDGYRVSDKKATKFGDNMALNDFLQDLKLVLTSKSKSKKKKKFYDRKDEDDDSLNSNDEDEQIAEVTVTRKLKALLSSRSLNDDEGDEADQNDEERGTSPLHEIDDNGADDNHDNNGAHEEEHELDLDELRRALAASLLSPELQETTAALLRDCVRDKMRSSFGGDASTSATIRRTTAVAQARTKRDESVAISGCESTTSYGALHQPAQESSRIKSISRKSIEQVSIPDPPPQTPERQSSSDTTTRSRNPKTPQDADELHPPSFPPPPPPASSDEEDDNGKENSNGITSHDRHGGTVEGPNHEAKGRDFSSLDNEPQTHVDNAAAEKSSLLSDGVALRPSIFTKMSSLEGGKKG
jgi:hypothetical protein